MLPVKKLPALDKEGLGVVDFTGNEKLEVVLLQILNKSVYFLSDFPL